MENMADKTLFMNEPATDRIAPLKDPREMKYRLAVRLADNMQLGEAIRILEALGDYSDSRTLLEEYRTLKACSDEAEARLRAERSDHARRSALLHSSAARMDKNTALRGERSQARGSVHQLVDAVVGQRELGVIAGSDDRQQDGRGRRRVSHELRVLVELAGKGAVAVVGRVHESAGDEHRELLVALCGGRFAVRNARLVVYVVLIHMPPLGVVGLGKIGYRRGLGRGLRRGLRCLIGGRAAVGIAAARRCRRK